MDLYELFLDGFSPLEQAAIEQFRVDGNRETFCAHMRIAAQQRGLDMARKASQRLQDHFTFVDPTH